MKRFTLVLLSALVTGVVAAQQPGGKCGSNIVLQQELAKDPGLAAQHAQFVLDVQNYVASHPDLGQKNTSGIRIIPVVFHVIHDGGSENITKQQIISQLDSLNKDFRRMNADTVDTPEAFDSVAADCRIEFRFANFDPEGKCTDGIVRVQSPRTEGASNQNGVKELSFWGCQNYLNIWVVRNIGVETNIGGEVIGYAQFPLGGSCSTDGVVLNHAFTGNIHSPNGTTVITARGRTATHEVGHWLGLRHIWGDSDCGNDFIADTPIHKEANFGCYAWPKLNDCVGGDSIRGEMFMNYMDYTNDDCMDMFTKGQKAVMDWTLEGPADSIPGLLGFREHLWSLENLQATGVLNNPPQECMPTAAFFANRQMICEGSTVTFTDNSFNGTVDTRQWTLEGANNTSPTTANPTATYATPGIYDASITVNNANGSSTATKNDYIIVSSDVADKTAPFYYENFNDWFDPRFYIFNDDSTQYRFEYVTGVGTAGNACMRVKTLGNYEGSVEELITPSYDVSQINGTINLRFKYSGTAIDTSISSTLQVYYSTNCGQSWTPRGNPIGGPALANGGLFTGSYEPWSVTEWTQYTIAMPSNLSNQDNVRFMFRYTHGGGANNLYIDDINITDPTGLNEDLASSVNLNLFPNPTTGDAFMVFALDKNEQVHIDVTDMVGRKVADVYNGTLGAGKQNIKIDNSVFGSAGVYFIRMQIDNRVAVKKLIVTQQQ